MDSNQFYRRGDLLPIPRGSRQDHSTESEETLSSLNMQLQTIGTTLCDMQTQLSTIQQQNSQQDIFLHQLEKDIKGLKSKQSAESLEQTQKTKKCRKSPPGLSVSNVIKN